ncbi:MAG: type II toxin-antitoxin system VapC family toxin [Acidobacteria bacterium]|nr:type II toxin-antitoxin system VapC family toxin [Acidobacteriota bacterium]
MSPPSLVLDSWAVVALLEQQAAAATVEELLEDAQANRRVLWMTTVNLGEVWYILARRKSEEVADRELARLLQIGIRVADVDWALTRRAARLKTKYRRAYADCFAAALAQQLRCTVATGDPEFRQLEKEVKVQWL